VEYRRLGDVAEEAGLTLPQLALAWVLREPNVASAIVGASRPEQVEANASASGIKLSEDTLEQSTKPSETSSCASPGYGTREAS
jgi:aryl-alcohol dehydrogenase-like predicted oxidoreductase